MTHVAKASTEFSLGLHEWLLLISLQIFFCLIACDLGPFWELVYPACLSRCSHSSIAVRYAGPTAAACWRTGVYPIPNHERELAPKPLKLQPEDRQPESISAYPGGYLNYIFILN